MDKKQTLQQVDQRYAIIQNYDWIIINIAGVQALIKAFILDDSQVYNLFLLKRQIY